MEKTQMKNDTDSKMKTQTPKMHKYMKTQRKKIKSLREYKRRLGTSIKKHENEVMNQNETTIQERINGNIKSRSLRRNYKRIENAIWRQARNYKRIENAMKKHENEV